MKKLRTMETKINLRHAYTIELPEKGKFSEKSANNPSEFTEDHANRNIDDREKKKLSNPSANNPSKFTEDHANRNIDDREKKKLSNPSANILSKITNDFAKRINDNREHVPLKCISIARQENSGILKIHSNEYDNNCPDEGLSLIHISEP